MKGTIKTVAVIGHFGFGLGLTNGQTVKTVTVTNALKERFGADEVLCFDTHGGAKALLKLPLQVINSLKKANNIIVLPAQRGLRVMTPLLVFFNRFFRRRLHYCVIGGWLPSLLQGKKRLVRQLRRFDGVYVETVCVRDSLSALPMDNVFLLPNCKQLSFAPLESLSAAPTLPLRVCTFSRVMREKGIEDAVHAVTAINQAAQRTVYTLDIYGAVEASQTDWFAQLQKDFPQGVAYWGVVPFDDSVRVLSGYTALLFPTRFFTEGIPGTIIDAYAAGLPVISARWQSFDDIIEEGVTGFGYTFGSEEALRDALAAFADTIACLPALRQNCLQRAQRYLPANAMQPLFDHIENH